MIPIYDIDKIIRSLNKAVWNKPIRRWFSFTVVDSLVLLYTFVENFLHSFHSLATNHANQCQAQIFLI